MYVAFHEHRFVINLGYTSGAIAGVATMAVAAFGEIAFEIIVDAFALDVEFRNGIDLNEFWSMWRKNPGKLHCESKCMDATSTVLSILFEYLGCCFLCLLLLSGPLSPYPHVNFTTYINFTQLPSAAGQ